MADTSASRFRWPRTSLLLVLAFMLGIVVDRTGWFPNSRYSSQAPQAAFYEAWRLVEDQYVDRQAVRSDRMTEGSIRGMLAYLGDIGHTTYLTKEEFSQMEKSLEGQLEGIGARLTLRKGRPTVVQTFPESPARKAGLLPGDVLLEAGGKNLHGLSLQKVVELVRGPPDSTLDLRVQRKDKTDPLELHLRRGKVHIPDVSWHMLPGTPFAHLAILSFGAKVDEQLRTALADAQSQKAQGLILDVRGNPGGLKEQAVTVSSEFLAEGTVFIEQDAEGRQTKIGVRGKASTPTLPLVVLIDEGSASSAEIFAGALQDHQRGKLVGTRTFGTGTVLQPFSLSDGSVVLLAVKEWLTPKGRQIWHQGITPDETVTLPADATLALPELEATWSAADLAKSDDVQMQKALELLKAEVHP